MNIIIEIQDEEIKKRILLEKLPLNDKNMMLVKGQLQQEFDEWKEDIIEDAVQTLYNEFYREEEKRSLMCRIFGCKWEKVLGKNESDNYYSCKRCKNKTSAGGYCIEAI